MRQREIKRMVTWINKNRPCMAPMVEGAPSWLANHNGLGWNTKEGYIVLLFSDGIIWKPNSPVDYAFKKTFTGEFQTVIKDQAGRAITVPGQFIPAEPFGKFFANSDGMLYPLQKRKLSKTQIIKHRKREKGLLAR